MTSPPRDETSAERMRRQAAQAMREVLDEVLDEHDACVTALTIDGMLDGIVTFLADQVGQDAAILKLRNHADELERRPHIRLVHRSN